MLQLSKDYFVQYRCAVQLLAKKEVTSPALHMSTKSEGEAQLRHMDIKVKDMCDDLDPVYIIKYPGSAPFMQSELWDISSVLYKYKSDLRAFLLVYNSELTEQEVVLWEKGLQNTEEVVKAHKLSVESTVNQVMPPSKHMLGPMTCYETKMIQLKEQSLKLKQDTLLSRMGHLDYITSTPNEIYHVWL